MIGGSEVPLRVTRDPNLAEEWELVLIAEGLSPRLRRTENGVVLSVPEEEVEKALAGLSAYERETPPQPKEGDRALETVSLPAGIAVAGLLLGFFSATVLWYPAVP